MLHYSKVLQYRGAAAALFSSRRPKNFENEKIFLRLKIEKNHPIFIMTPEKQDKTLELSKH